jgi:hypothetical protein
MTEKSDTNAKKRKLSSDKTPDVFPGMEGEVQDTSVIDSSTASEGNQFISRMKQMASVSVTGTKEGSAGAEFKENRKNEAGQNPHSVPSESRVIGDVPSTGNTTVDKPESALNTPDLPVDGPKHGLGSAPGETAENEQSPVVCSVDDQSADISSAMDTSEGHLTNDKVTDNTADNVIKGPTVISAASTPKAVTTSGELSTRATPPASMLSSVHVQPANRIFHSSPAFRAPQVARTNVPRQSQPQVMVVKGSDMSPAALTELLQAKGIIIDPQKVNLYVTR